MPNYSTDHAGGRSERSAKYTLVFVDQLLATLVLRHSVTHDVRARDADQRFQARWPPGE
ncbi:hypothetical protein [Streptomyces sp. NPDC086010]|uniref:hypothetical protein n=1 Tax=Streptomyces sp. NPDC086010 TaxID=3365745 RepID=UPI0037CCE568